MSVQKSLSGNTIEEAVKAGLSAESKYLPSWLLYDERGDELFRKIMKLPEYYLTRSETEILHTYSDAIAWNLQQESSHWDIVELGAGDGTKTAIFLASAFTNGLSIRYYPVDISANTLSILARNMHRNFSALEVHTVNADYIQGLSSILRESHFPRVILFLGSNIGNLEVSAASVFLRKIATLMKPTDRLMVAFDLMKSPEIIEKAYFDSAGVTTEFNKNVLLRINRELGGNFDTAQFEHWPIYDPVTGACRSYLVSSRYQEVSLEALKMKVSFKPWEPIYMEVSQKYSEEMIMELISVSGLFVEKLLFDSDRSFTVSLLRTLG